MTFPSDIAAKSSCNKCNSKEGNASLRSLRRVRFSIAPVVQQGFIIFLSAVFFIPLSPLHAVQDKSACRSCQVPPFPAPLFIQRNMGNLSAGQPYESKVLYAALTGTTAPPSFTGAPLSFSLLPAIRFRHIKAYKNSRQNRRNFIP